MVILMARYEGKCSNCGKTHSSPHKGSIITCDCYEHCPICGAEMTPYTPDLAANTYSFDGHRDLAVLMVCTNHFPIFFSTLKPVEVVCT